MFIRGFPLYGYLMTISTPHLFMHFLSPVVNYYASSKMIWCFQSELSSWNIKLIDTLRVDRHRAPCLSGDSPIWLLNDCLHTYFCQFYRPLLIIPRRVKWFVFSVDTMEVKLQIHRHSKGWSASGPMFIRGFLLYGYFITVSTHIFANFITRCELFSVE